MRQFERERKGKERQGPIRHTRREEMGEERRKSRRWSMMGCGAVRCDVVWCGVVW